MKLIKKYKNRRLYDTEKSKYITIDDVKNYVLQGVEFSVEDASNHQDLTNNTLLQILFETGSQKSGPFFSTSFLRQLITMSNNPMNKALQDLLENVANSFQKITPNQDYQKNLKETTAAWDRQVADLSDYWKNFFKNGNN